MASPLTDLAPPELATGSGLEHLVCCVDDVGIESFCGLDVSGQPWGAGPATIDCVVCAEMSAADYCPWFGRCSERPDWAE